MEEEEKASPGDTDMLVGRVGQKEARKCLLSTFSKQSMLQSFSPTYILWLLTPLGLLPSHLEEHQEPKKQKTVAKACSR